MISHKHKCIFIHIPKTAGTSINNFFYPQHLFHTHIADYDKLFGWCPKRQMHMQHATASELMEKELITEAIWESYFKFTFIRNPWDRSYSDYLWMQSFSGIKGSFKDYILAKGPFEKILNDNSNIKYLGDHLRSQTEYFDLKGKYEVDFIGRFENFDNDIHTFLEKLKVDKSFSNHDNKTVRKTHYSKFYTNTKKKLVDEKYEFDIEKFGYDFEDKRKGMNTILKWL